MNEYNKQMAITLTIFGVALVSIVAAICGLAVLMQKIAPL